MTEANRAYSAAHFLLELDQRDKVGFLRSVQGGGVKADTLTHQLGNTRDLWKQMSKPKYEDITFEVGMAMGETFCKWVEDFVSGRVVRKTGTILAADFQYKERARREFTEALITELSIPKLDGADKNPCYLSVKITPEELHFRKGAGTQIQAEIKPQKQKLWTPANFALTIDDKKLKDALRRVTKIDPFKITQKILEYPSGNRRFALRVPGRIEYPNLTFYIPEADSKPFEDAFTKRVLKGEPAPATRLTGAIEMRDNKNDTLCTMKLTGIDVANVAPEKSDSSGDAFKLVKVEITVEKMSFEYKRDTGGGASANPAADLA